MKQASSLKDFLQLRIDEINRNEDITPRLRSLLLADMENIRVCMEESQNRSAALATEIQYFIESEFMNKICSYHTEDSHVEFCMDAESVKLNYSIQDDMVLKETVQIADGDNFQYNILRAALSYPLFYCCASLEGMEISCVANVNRR